MVHTTKVPANMPKGFWLEFLSSEIAMRVIESQNYKPLSVSKITEEYELSDEDKKHVIDRAEMLVRARLKGKVYAHSALKGVI
jgi:hypothetical protein